MITIAAPVYLKKMGELRNIDIAVCGIALALLMIPTVGSVYPIPDAPVLYFPYLFLAYLASGAAWIFYVRFRNLRSRRRSGRNSASSPSCSGLDDRSHDAGGLILRHHGAPAVSPPAAAPLPYSPAST